MILFTYISLGYLISWLYSLTNNYLFAVLGAVIIFNICFIWIDIIKQKNTNKLVTMRPDILKIQEKYSNAQINKKEMNKEIKTIYKENNYSRALMFILSTIKTILNILFFYIVMNPLTFISDLSSTTINSIKEIIRNTGAPVIGYPQLEIINFIDNHDISEIIPIIPNIATLNIPSLQIGIFNLSELPSFSWPTIIFPIMAAVIHIIPIILSKKNKLNSQTSTTLLSNSLTVILAVIISFWFPMICTVLWLSLTAIDDIKNVIFKHFYQKKKFLTTENNVTIEDEQAKTIIQEYIKNQ